VFSKSLGDLACCESRVVILRSHSSRMTCVSSDWNGCQLTEEGTKKAFNKQRAVALPGSKSEGIKIGQMGCVTIW